MIDALLHLILERLIAVEKKKILKFSSTRHRKKVRLIIYRRRGIQNFKLSSLGSIICIKIQQWFKNVCRYRKVRATSRNVKSVLYIKKKCTKSNQRISFYNEPNQTTVKRNLLALWIFKFSSQDSKKIRGFRNKLRC